MHNFFALLLLCFPTNKITSLFLTVLSHLPFCPVHQVDLTCHLHMPTSLLFQATIIHSLLFASGPNWLSALPAKMSTSLKYSKPFYTFPKSTLPSNVTSKTKNLPWDYDETCPPTEGSNLQSEVLSSLRWLRQQEEEEVNRILQRHFLFLRLPLPQWQC